MIHLNVLYFGDTWQVGAGLDVHVKRLGTWPNFVAMQLFVAVWRLVSHASNCTSQQIVLF